MIGVNDSQVKSNITFYYLDKVQILKKINNKVSIINVINTLHGLFYSESPQIHSLNLLSKTHSQ